MQGVLVGMLVEEVRRDADETVARETLRQVAGMLHQAVALVHQHDPRQFPAHRWRRQERRQPAGAADLFRHDVGHCSRHSGAERSEAPGIHTHGRWLWIPGSPLRGAPE
jgi:hypothetical protein